VLEVGLVLLFEFPDIDGSNNDTWDTDVEAVMSTSCFPVQFAVVYIPDLPPEVGGGCNINLTVASRLHGHINSP